MATCIYIYKIYSGCLAEPLLGLKDVKVYFCLFHVRLATFEKCLIEAKKTQIKNLQT